MESVNEGGLKIEPERKPHVCGGQRRPGGDRQQERSRGVRLGKPGPLTISSDARQSSEVMAKKRPLTLSVRKTSATFTEGEDGSGVTVSGGVKGGRGSARNQCELVFGLRKKREIH